MFPVSYIFSDFPLNKSDVAPCKPKYTLLVKQDTYEPWALSGSAGIGGFSYIYMYIYMDMYAHLCLVCISYRGYLYMCIYIFNMYILYIYKKNTCEFLKEHVDILNAYMYICVYTRI